jgi:NAD(P)-dependent dehydrogenase (short-subunit alcohol dehydrogenase family)
VHNGCVVVTGVAGGIGQALSQAFSAAGYRVVGIDKVEPPVRDNFFIHCNLSEFANDTSYAEKKLLEIRHALRRERLSALIHNAATQVLGSVEELDRNAWQSTLSINVLAPFFLTQALLPELEASNGHVINIGSIHARLTKAKFCAYATSKAALAGLARAMAVELGSRIRVTTIEPAAIETAMLLAGFADSPEQLDALRTCHPTKQLGQPHEVARLARMIVCENIHFLTGSTISLDGGISGRLHDPQ